MGRRPGAVGPDRAFTLPGGEVGFAIGAQYRKNGYARDYSADQQPRRSSRARARRSIPAATCNPQTGALGFLGTNRDAACQRRRLGARSPSSSCRSPTRIQAQLSGALRGLRRQRRLDLRSAGARQVRADRLAGAARRRRAPPSAARRRRRLFGNLTSLQSSARRSARSTSAAIRTSTPESATTYNGGVIVDAGGVPRQRRLLPLRLRRTDRRRAGAGHRHRAVRRQRRGELRQPGLSPRLQARFTFTAAGCGIANVTAVAHQHRQLGATCRTSGIDFTGQLPHALRRRLRHRSRASRAPT